MLKARAALRVCQRDAEPLGLKAVEQAVKADELHKRCLDQQVGPSLAIAGQYKLLVARPERPGKRDLGSGHQLEGDLLAA